MMRILLTIFSATLLLNSAWAQDASSEDEFFSFETPVTINMDAEDEPIDVVKKKKRKLPKNTYYGVKTKKGFIRAGGGNSLVLEIFSFLKEPVEPDNLVRDIYWYDFKRKMIRKSDKYDPKEGALLHGPYKKMQDDQVLDSGVFYMGLKHGTWMYHDKNDILIDKEKYYRGWPRESRVRYYDRDKEKLREIIPVEFGEREGNYFYFFESGRIAVRGEYRWGQRVGDWTEYYPNGRKKKVIRYPREPYGDEPPFVFKEWNRTGREVYDYLRVSR